jgi:membrane-bound lytic murein transglycosylase D
MNIFIPKPIIALFFLAAGFAMGAVLMQGTSYTDDDSYKTYVTENYKVFSVPIPSSLSFAGEEVPLHWLDVREKFDREILVNTYRHSATFLNIKRAERWFPVMEPILAKNGIPDDFKYLCVIESDLTNAVSPAGARGFWQFMEGTAKQYGLEVTADVDERYHVEKSTEAACKYLNDAYKKFGSWALVAASYNMGMGGVNGEMNKQKVSTYWDLQLNEETSRYVYRILAMREIMRSPESYGFHVRDKDRYPAYEVEYVKVDTDIADLAAFAKEKGVNYKTLKVLNPWLRKTSLENKAKKEYQVALPKDKGLWVE